jgi:5'/3'-nucleotidase
LRILLTNDDGVRAEGLMALKDRLAEIAPVTIVAPDRERSAVSHMLTLRNPLRFKRIDENTYAVDGTPADSVFIALAEIMKDNRPAIVVSGINRGANVGDDVNYSGTVAGAREAAMHCIQSFAISSAARRHHNFGQAADFAARLVEFLRKNPLPPRTLLNVNIPEASSPDREGEYRFTRLGQRVYRDGLVKNTNPRGEDYYWIGGEQTGTQNYPNSDIETVANGYISVTPLGVDQTEHALLTKLQASGIRR